MLLLALALGCAVPATRTGPRLGVRELPAIELGGPLGGAPGPASPGVGELVVLVDRHDGDAVVAIDADGPTTLGRLSEQAEPVVQLAADDQWVGLLYGPYGPGLGVLDRSTGTLVDVPLSEPVEHTDLALGAVMVAGRMWAVDRDERASDSLVAIDRKGQVQRRELPDLEGERQARVLGLFSWKGQPLIHWVEEVRTVVEQGSFDGSTHISILATHVDRVDADSGAFERVYAAEGHPIASLGVTDSGLLLVTLPRGERSVLGAVELETGRLIRSAASADTRVDGYVVGNALMGRPTSQGEPLKRRSIRRR